jgi:acylphosphatase
MPALRLLVSGRVQGVGYRDWARQQALALALDGWVRNLGDGRVEAMACGVEDALACFVEALGRGPSLARVDRIEQLPGETVSTSGFEVRPTS